MSKNYVDFVLVWEKPPPDSNKKDEAEILQKRRIFEKNLEDEGLFLEREHLEGSNLNFVKIHPSIEVLRRYTEILRLRMPMKEFDEDALPAGPTGKRKRKLAAKLEESSRFGKYFSWIYDTFDFDHSKFPSMSQRLSAIYSRDKEYLFDIHLPDFFTEGNRSRIIDFIIRRKRFSLDPMDESAFGIDRLLRDKVYTGAYPLHDGDLKTRGSIRHTLYTEWASLKKFHKAQPLDAIKEYFGVSIGLYFAWLGYYTRMLIPASILGFICFIYGIGTMGSDIYSKQVCSGKDSYVMCPLCTQVCEYWWLNSTCVQAKFTYVSDNNATILFAVLMSFWAAIFLEFWKRYSAQITHKWDLSSFDTKEEQPRLEYLARLKKLKKLENDVSAPNAEPKVSFWRTRVPYSLFSLSSVLFLLTLAGAVIVAVIAYRVSMSIHIYKNYPEFQSKASLIVTSTSAIINLFMICIFNFLYTFVATYLTEMELHRTQSEFDDSLILKIYVLQFVNYYSSIFYIAFFKGRFGGPPNTVQAFLENERCGSAGCMTDLTIQLSIVMVGKQSMNCVLEMSGPLILQWIKHFRILIGSKKQSSRRPTFQTQWAKDYKLLDWNSRSLFNEYLEMILQYGFVTIFVAAFPLAPFFALLNNILEMRLDGTKMLMYNKRPVGQRVKDIGVWYGILDSVSRVAVISNALIIAFTSHFIPKVLYYFVEEDPHFENFLHHSLVSFNVSDFTNETRPLTERVFKEVEDNGLCWYSAYNYNHTMPEYRRYQRTSFFWKLMVARLVFVVVFQNVVSICVLVLKVIIPDVPKNLQKRMQFENYLTNEIIIRQEMLRAREQRREDGVPAPAPAPVSAPDQGSDPAARRPSFDFVRRISAAFAPKPATVAESSGSDSDSEGTGVREAYV